MASASHQSTGTPRRPYFSRRRTAYACDSCRSRKTRCDGQTPCSTCLSLAVTCTYGTESTPSKGKGDLILNAILRVENSVQQIEERLVDLQLQSTVHNNTFQRFEGDSPLPGASSVPSQSHIPSKSSTTHFVDNAIISVSHNSTTESILRWSVFDDVPRLRESNQASIFELENLRPGVRVRAHSPPYISSQDVQSILAAFERSVNFFYPIVSCAQQQEIMRQITTGDLDESLESWLALVVMALGCAAAGVSAGSGQATRAEDEHQKHYLALSQAFFNTTRKMEYLATTNISPSAAQCTLLTALYYAFLQRPLQAWSMLGAVASKCQVLLAYGNLHVDQNECVRRMFWSCYILESDYLAELSLLPHFGIAETESSVPLPGRFHSHQDEHMESQSSLYFLACISMRRLLNRVHYLLFDKEAEANLNDTRYGGMVAELDQQLTRWRELLPNEFQFSIDRVAVHSEHGAFLRQRYLTCKALIYRPFLIKALSDASAAADPTVQNGCRICLDACILHCLNLDHFSHTILIDVWICALSMSGAMLIFLAVDRLPSLKHCLREDVHEVGYHLRHLLSSWSSGTDPSPSVCRAIEWITVVDSLLQG